MFKKKKYLCSSALVLSPLLLNDVHAIVASEEERLHYESRYGAEHMENDSVLKEFESENETLRTRALNTVKNFFNFAPSVFLDKLYETITIGIIGNVDGIDDLEEFHLARNRRTNGRFYYFLDKLKPWVVKHYQTNTLRVIKTLSSQVAIQYPNWDAETLVENYNYESTYEATDPITIDLPETILDDATITVTVTKDSEETDGAADPITITLSATIPSDARTTVTQKDSGTVSYTATSPATEGNSGEITIDKAAKSISIKNVDAGEYTLKISINGDESTGKIKVLPTPISVELSVSNKEHDGNKIAIVTVTPSGILEKDGNDVTITIEAEFASSESGTHDVTLTKYELSGGRSSNYTLAEYDGTLSGTITENLSITLEDYKTVYGRKDPITIGLPETIPSEATITVTVAKDPGTVSYTASSPSTEDNSDKITIDVANKNISIQNLDAGEYALTVSINGKESTGTITVLQRLISVALSVSNKEYDENNQASVTVTPSGILEEDKNAVTITIRAEFASAEVGTHDVSLKSDGLSGDRSSNYTLAPYEDKLTGTITKKLAIGINSNVDGTPEFITLYGTSTLPAGTEVIMKNTSDKVLEGIGKVNNDAGDWSWTFTNSLLDGEYKVRAIATVNGKTVHSGDQTFTVVGGY